METRDPDVRAYFVWAPFLKPDTEKTARESTARCWAPNSVYFWAPDQNLCLEAGQVLQLAAGRPAWDVYMIYRRGVLWEKVFPQPAYWQQQLDILQGEKYDPPTLRVKLQEILRQR